MIVTHLHGEPSQEDVPILAFPTFSEEEPGEFEVQLNQALGGALARVRAAGDLTGRAGEAVMLYGPEVDGPHRILALGVGPRAKYDLEAIRRLAGRVVRSAEELRLEDACLQIEASDSGVEASCQAAAEGAVVAAWRYTEAKNEAAEGAPPLDYRVERLAVVCEGPENEVEDGLRAGMAVGSGANLARILQSRPGNVATPTHLAEQVVGMGATCGCDVTIMGPKEIQAEEMHALLAVSRGSVEEPRFIVMRHEGGAKGEAPLVLVGKGLTFDAGGISIKPASGMEEMKYDMSGGAAVIGAMQAICELEVPLNVVGIVPSAENLPSGSAMKPGDIIDTREGKTVEVVNTDAEGRLILADALSYAQTLAPRAIVDCATLTGAVVVALGNEAIGLMGNDETLIEELRAAGDSSGERVWPLPMFEEYRRQIDSEVADLVNVGGRSAGSITAGWFLREFVGDIPWAHLDIAGTAYGEGKLPYQRKGAYGVPARLLVEWVRGHTR